MVSARAFRMSAYAEIAVTTNYSFLRGASHPRELVQAATELGLAAIGIADRNTLAGVVRAYAAHQEIRGDKPKLLVGARLVFMDGTPVSSRRDYLKVARPAETKPGAVGLF